MRGLVTRDLPRTYQRLPERAGRRHWLAPAAPMASTLSTRALTRPAEPPWNGWYVRVGTILADTSQTHRVGDPAYRAIAFSSRIVGVHKGDMRGRLSR